MILYTVGNGLYINLTNRCPCRCTFCIRNHSNGIGTGENLWLQRDPSAQEVIEALRESNLEQYEEIVFCGYGEPTCQLETLLAVCDYLKGVTKKKIRLNSNGLSDLINQKPTATLLQGRIDSISISLNAPTEEEYLAVSHPSFGKIAFDAMLKFAADCKQFLPEVQFSVVDVITQEQVERCKQLANSMGIPLRIREYIK